VKPQSVDGRRSSVDSQSSVVVRSSVITRRFNGRLSGLTTTVAVLAALLACPARADAALTEATSLAAVYDSILDARTLFGSRSEGGRGAGLDFALEPYLPGDANGDFAVNVADVFFLINALFAGGAAPPGLANVNGDSAVDVTDVFFLINRLFANGSAPVCAGT